MIKTHYNKYNCKVIKSCDKVYSIDLLCQNKYKISLRIYVPVFRKVMQSLEHKNSIFFVKSHRVINSPKLSCLIMVFFSFQVY